jgi:hypothetical protein
MRSENALALPKEVPRENSAADFALSDNIPDATLPNWRHDEDG